MSILFNGSTDRLDGSTSPISGVPATFAAWVNPDVIPQSNKVILGCYDNNSTNAILDIRLGGTGDSGTIIFRNNSSVQNAVGATTAMSAGTWYHVCGTVNSSGGVEIFQNGQSEGTDLDSISTTVDLFECAIGYRSSNNDSFFDGRIAECAIWNRILIASEIVALSKKYSPLWIPRGLVFYKSLIRNINHPNIGPVLSATGTSVLGHIGIIYPRKKLRLPQGIDLYSVLDEITPNDNDYIISPLDPDSAACEVRLTSHLNPAAGPQTIRYRYYKIGNGTLDFTLKLFQGTTEIASWTHNNVSSTITQGSQTLTTEQKAAITDRTNLRFRFIANTP